MIVGPVIVGIATGLLAFVMLWSKGVLIALIGAQLAACLTVLLGAGLLVH